MNGNNRRFKAKPLKFLFHHPLNVFIPIGTPNRPDTAIGEFDICPMNNGQPDAFNYDNGSLWLHKYKDHDNSRARTSHPIRAFWLPAGRDLQTTTFRRGAKFFFTPALMPSSHLILEVMANHEIRAKRIDPDYHPTNYEEGNAYKSPIIGIRRLIGPRRGFEWKFYHQTINEGSITIANHTQRESLESAMLMKIQWDDEIMDLSTILKPHYIDPKMKR